MTGELNTPTTLEQEIIAELDFYLWNHQNATALEMARVIIARVRAHVKEPKNEN